jgi:glycosyltransferase 2 family protein
LFIFFLNKLGKDALQLITQNFSWYYITIYFIITLFAICPLVWRWQVILKAYNIKIPFISLLRMQMAGYTLSYITPASRVGGEPLRVYMLNQEHNVDLKTGTVSIVLDRYLELLGTVAFGVVGLILFLFTPISYKIKLMLSSAIILSSILLITFYYRLSKNKPFFSKIRYKKFNKTLEDIDNKMSDFIINHKKEFVYSFLFYCLSGFLFLIEFKYLLLSFGIESSITEIILIVTMLGAINFIPIPAQLGSLEAGQITLFKLLKGQGDIGMALSLLMRVRYLILISIGFLIISHFGFREIFKLNKNPKTKSI